MDRPQSPGPATFWMSPTALTDLIIHDELSPPPEDIEPIDAFDAVCLDIEY